MRHRIFLSHSDQDHEIVRLLYDDLKKLGFEVWFDEVSLKPGDNLAKKIESGISGSNFVVIALSPQSVASAWVKKEAILAIERQYSNANIRVIPILVKECEVPPYMKEKVYANLQDKEKQRLEFGRLLSVFYTDGLTESTPLRLVSSNAIVESRTQHHDRQYSACNVRTESKEDNKDVGGTYWLLPDRGCGKLTMQLGRPHHVRLIRILNTRNGIHNDRAANKISVSLSLEGEHPRIAWKGGLPCYPEWLDLWLNSWYADTIVIAIHSFRNNGGGLNCVQVYAAQ